jgi:hypothetical protein
MIGGVIGGDPTQRPVVLGAFARESNTDPYEFATYDTGANPDDPADDIGLRPLAASEVVPTIPAGVSNANVRADLPLTLSSSAAINTLSLKPTASLSLANASLTLTGGMILHTSTNPPPAQPRVAGNGQIAFTDEGIIRVSGHEVIDVPISAPSLTASTGAGTLELRRANNIAGGITVDGNLAITNSEALGTAPVRVTRGRVAVVGQSQTIANDFVFDNRLAANGTLFGTVGVLTAPGLTTTLTGDLSGAGFVWFRNRVRVTGSGAFDVLDLTADDTQVDGTLSATESVLIRGTRLSGNGTVHGTVRTQFLSPGGDFGAAVGRLTIDGTGPSFGVAFPVTDTYEFDLAGVGSAGDAYDQLVVEDTLVLTNDSERNTALAVSLAAGFSPPLGSQFELIDNLFSGPVNGFFTGLPEGAVFGADGSNFQITYTGGDGNDVVLTTVIPEPTVGVAGLALASCLTLARRRRK